LFSEAETFQTPSQKLQIVRLPCLNVPSHGNGGRGGGVHERPPHGIGLLDGDWKKLESDQLPDSLGLSAHTPSQRLLSNLLRDHDESAGTKQQ
jgi:hypothetical protein